MARQNKVEAKWINYIDSRQAGNCESGSRAWSQSLAYVIAQKYALNLRDKSAWEDLAKRLSRASESNPIASISLSLCDQIMSEVESWDAYDFADSSVSCSHECDEYCLEECEHECDSDCFSRGNMVQAIETLQGYSETEWPRAYEYASKGSFIRALDIPEHLHAFADSLSISQYANANNILADMRARDNYEASARTNRRIPRVDFGNALADSYSLASLVFMAKFSPDQFDSFGKLFCMSLTPTPNMSLLAFRRNPASALAFVQDTQASVTAFALANEEAYRTAYATWLTSQLRGTLQEHALNSLYNFDINLHANVGQYELTETFNTVRYNQGNVYNALARLVQYALQDKNNARFVTSVSYFACVARVLSTRLSHYQVTYLTESNASEIISQTYYWREIHAQAFREYVIAMRTRYAEMSAPVISEASENE